MKTREQCQNIAATLLRNRLARESRWRDLKRFVCPWRGVLEERATDNPNRRELLRFTHTASQATLRGASGMTSGMTPRNVSWFKPDFIDPAMTEQSGARPWLDQIDRLMKDCLTSGGFYQAIQSFNIDLVWAGCALLFAEEGTDNPLRYECQQVGSYAVGVDREGRLSTVLRSMRMTAPHMAQAFGEDKLGDATREMAKHKPYDTVRVMHLTLPADGGGPFPYECYWWEGGSGESFLRQGGYNEMPFFFTCWHEGITPYGMGPGDEALPDARQLDKLERYKLLGLGRLIEPPTQAPFSLKGHVDLSPGAINYVTENSPVTPILDLSPFAAALGNIREEIATVGNRISQSLMASIFTSMPLDQRPAGMSATEFLERKREALQQLGPVISAYEPNVLTPLLFRTVQTLDRKGLLPLAPETLQDQDLLLKMEFISPMANALRQSGAETTRALFQDVAMMAQAASNVEILDKIDMDQMVDELATGLGVPGSVIRADADVAALRQQRAEAQMRQQEMAMQMQSAQAMRLEGQAMREEAEAGAAMRAEAQANDGWL